MKISARRALQNDKGTFCNDATDSVDHMLIWCPFIKKNTLWTEVNEWITEIGFLDYNLTESRIISGDLENDPILNAIILLTRKVIYDSFKIEKKTSLVHIQNEMRNFFYLEKLYQKEATYL